MKPTTETLSRLALMLALAAGPAAAQPVCDHMTLTAARLPLVFVDGFESGGTLPWTLPVVERFSAAATEDLVAATTLLGDTSGDHLLTLRWLLPGAHLYQESAVPFTSDPGAGSANAGFRTIRSRSPCTRPGAAPERSPGRWSSSSACRSPARRSSRARCSVAGRCWPTSTDRRLPA